MSKVELTSDEVERYARHIVLPELGGAGQQKLKQARVLVIGAGGLGSPLIQYLAAAGVGTIGVVDDDVVSLSNLQRQVLHETAAIGMPKVDSASIAVGRINPHVTLESHEFRLSAENADSLIQNYDMVADGCDNFPTRYLLADICERLRRPLISAAVGKFDGTLTTFKPYERNDLGEENPRYRDLFPAPPPDGMVPGCAAAGIIGALTGVMGSLQAMEVIKEIAGLGTGLVGRLLMYDGLSARFQTTNYSRKK